MIRTSIVLSFCLFMGFIVRAQFSSKLPAEAWVDSVFNKLTPDEKIAQLMVVRGSSFDPKTKRPILYTKETEDAVRKYNVGGICMFQGGPQAQALFINHMQESARTPVLI